MSATECSNNHPTHVSMANLHWRAVTRLEGHMRNCRSVHPRWCKFGGGGIRELKKVKVNAKGLTNCLVCSRTGV